MANYKALKSGNYSDPTVGLLAAGIGDTVFANGFIVTIDINITCTEITNKVGTGIAANGYFLLTTTNRTLNCNIVNGQTIAANYCVQCTTPNLTININGKLSTVATYAAGDSTPFWTNNTATGMVINFTGDLDSSTSAITNDYVALIGGANSVVTVLGNIIPSTGLVAYGLYLNAGNTIANVIGDVYGGSTNSTTSIGLRAIGAGSVLTVIGNCYAKQGCAIYTNTGCTVNITGNGSFTTAGNTVGVFQLAATSTTFNHTGNVTGGPSQSAYYITGTSCVLNLYGNAIAGTGGHGVRVAATATNAQVYLQKCVGYQGVDISTTFGVINETLTATVIVGEVEFGTIGQTPTYGCVKFKESYITKVNVLLDNSTRRILSDATNDYVDPANVRDQTIYAFGTRVGTLKIPPKGAVVIGVPTDDGVGTLNPTVDVSTLAEDLLNEISVSANPIAERLRNVSTVQTTAEQIITLEA